MLLWLFYLLFFYLGVQDLLYRRVKLWQVLILMVLALLNTSSENLLLGAIIYLTFEYIFPEKLLLPADLAAVVSLVLTGDYLAILLGGIIGLSLKKDRLPVYSLLTIGLIIEKFIYMCIQIL